MAYTGSLSIPADVVSETFDETTVVINLANGRYYSFPAEATTVWRGLLVGEVPAADFTAWALAEGLVIQEGGSPGAPCEPPLGIAVFDDLSDLMLADPIHDVDYDGSGWATDASA